MNGKNKSKNLLIIVVVLGVLGLIASYQFVYTNYKNQAATLAASNNILADRVATLKVYYDNRDSYTASIKTMMDDVDGILADFPADVTLEDGIMEAVYMQAASEIGYESITLLPKEEVVGVPQDTITAIAEEKYTTALSFERSTVTYSNRVTYPEMKKAIQSIFERDKRISIDNISYVRTNAEGDPDLQGIIELSFFDIKGTNKVYEYPKLNEYIAGTENIFLNSTEVEPEEGEEGSVEE